MKPVHRRETVLVLLHGDRLLPSGAILVVGVLLHVDGPQPLRLVDEGSFLGLCQQFPLDAQSFRDLRVVHLRVLLRHLAPLTPRPDHEGVHRTLHLVVLHQFTLSATPGR